MITRLVNFVPEEDSFVPLLTKKLGVRMKCKSR